MVSSHILWPLLGVFKNICKVLLLDLMNNHHHIITSIFRLGCCACPIQWGWQHQATPNTGFPCISVLWINPSQATITDISLDRFTPCISRRPFYPSGTGKWKVCGRFCIGRGTLYMSIPFQQPDAKDCCNILNVKFLKMFKLGLWCHRSSGSWHCHCGGAALCPRCSDPTFRYPGAYPSGHRPCIPCHTPEERGAWRWGQAVVSPTFLWPHSIWRQWHCLSPRQSTACRPDSTKVSSTSSSVLSTSTWVIGLPSMGRELPLHLGQI